MYKLTTLLYFIHFYNVLLLQHLLR